MRLVERHIGRIGQLAGGANELDVQPLGLGVGLLGALTILAVFCGLCDPLKGWTRKDAALTDTFSIQQGGVDRTGAGLQLVEMQQA